VRSGSLEALRRQLADLEAEPLEDDEDVDPATFDWFSDSCSCGVPAGKCKIHPRARPGQRPPAEDWRTYLLLGGRAAGKTRAAAELVRYWVESGQASRIGLVGATSADYRDTMILGESGIISISPPWNRPKFEPSKRRLTWPNGAYAICLSSEEPERARGLQFDRLWCDELCAWQYPQRMWELVLLCLRIGTSPQAVVTTTPKRLKLLAKIMADPTTRLSRETTFANKEHLAPEFVDQITAMYADTRLGLQELMAEIPEVSDGAIYASFDATVGGKHINEKAEYDPRFQVHLAIDCGVSKHTAAVWSQVIPVDQHRSRINVFGDWHAEGLYSEAAAKAIKARSDSLPSHGRLDTVRLDPASSAQTGIGPAAYGAYETVFGSRVIGRWPNHRVADGIDQVSLLIDQGLLVIHPRCTKLREAILNYAWRPGRHGEWLDVPMDPAHPHEDLADALRGGIRDRFPEGCRIVQPNLRQVKFSRII